MSSDQHDGTANWQKPIAVMSRDLTVRDPGGLQQTAKMIVRIYPKEEDKSVWVCEHVIEPSPFVYTRDTAYGADPIHAFLLFLRDLRFQISEAEKDGCAIW